MGGFKEELALSRISQGWGDIGRVEGLACMEGCGQLEEAGLRVRGRSAGWWDHRARQLALWHTPVNYCHLIFQNASAPLSQLFA